MSDLVAELRAIDPDDEHDLFINGLILVRAADEITSLTAENARLRGALEQAQCCLLRETPEYGTQEEALFDTLEKVRVALNGGTDDPR